MIIKKYQDLSRDELYNILALRVEVFVVEQNCPYQDLDYKDQNSYHLLYKEDEKLVAYLRMILEENSYEVWIGRVLVAEAFRGRKIASRLVTKAVEFIKSNYPDYKVRLSAQTYAKSLYEDIGFYTVGEEYLEDDILHIHMILKS